MFNRISIIFLFIFILDGWSVSAQIPVILRATADEQNDTTGCNFVKEVCRITYETILSGKAKLWDSQTKDIQIFPSALLDIERSSGTLFVDEQVIFIYEYWSNNNKNLLSTTTGFLFSNKTNGGEEVAYGYVEFNDLQEAFMRSRIHTNANGNYNSNIASYLNNKNYNYKILQFAGKVIDNAASSQLIKDNFIGNYKFNVSTFSTSEILQKMVTWILNSSVDVDKNKTMAGKLLLDAVENYLRQNEEIFYNMGAEKISPHIQKGKWKITRIEVAELWKKINETVMFDPIGITIYVNDSALAEIQYRDMLKMDIRVGEKSWVEYIREKSFLYTIIRVNYQDIPRREAYQYQKGLLTYDWNKVTEFVKFY